jgi:hypothetical protein
VDIKIDLHQPLREQFEEAIRAAADSFGAFLNKPVETTWNGF